MKGIRNVCLALLCTMPLAGCSTTHLVRWAMDEPSVYHEPEGDVSRGVLKGFVTFVGFPIAVVWDIGTFPFQLIGGAYPYGDSTMQPGDDTDL